MRAAAQKELKELGQSLEEHGLDFARDLVIETFRVLSAPRSEIEIAIRLAAKCRSKQELQEVVTRFALTLAGK